MRFSSASLLCASLSLAPWLASAEALPYSTRTKPFEAMASTVRGDARTVAMGGVGVGIPDSYTSALENPAGLAVAIWGASTGINSNWILDQSIQGNAIPLFSLNTGIAWAPYPWGISIGYMIPYEEGQAFSQGDHFMTHREIQIGVSRIFVNNRLSLGIQILGGSATRQTGTEYYNTFGIGATGGLLVQLPHRWFLGLMGSTPQYYPGSNSSPATTPGFFQPVIVPARSGIGAGWIPNRFFRAGLSVYLYGTSAGTALLRDENISIGSFMTVSPHIGASYQWLELGELKSTLMAGSYIEWTRTNPSAVRPHITLGIELVPWVIILMGAVDIAPGYINFQSGIGVDLLRLFQKLDLVDKTPRPSLGGFLPKINHLSHEGLPRSMVPEGQLSPDMDIDPIQATREIPSRLQKKTQEMGRQVLDGIKGKEGQKK